MPVNLQVSEEIAWKVRAKPKCCYENAMRALLWCDELDKDHAYYVEGIAVGYATRVPFHHGWVEVGDEIIDPTFTPTTIKKLRAPNSTPASKALFAQMRSEGLAEYARGSVPTYMPVARYTHQAVLHFVRDYGHYGPLDEQALDNALVLLARKPMS